MQAVSMLREKTHVNLLRKWDVGHENKGLNENKSKVRDDG